MIKFSYLIFFLILFNLNFSFANSIINLTEDNWNNIKSMTGQFKQTNHDGSIQHGNFYIQKPYRSLFEYHNQLENILISKYFLHIINEKHHVIDTYPIGSNPIKYLLLDNLKIDEHFDHSEQEIDHEYILHLMKKDRINDYEQVSLYFHKETLNLRKWEITNESGEKISLEFTKNLKNISISPDKFVIHHINLSE